MIIDELSYIKMDKERESLFFQVIRRRYEKNPLIITTNLPVGRWDELFTGKPAATATLDRLMHHCHVLSITGDSYRIKKNSVLNDERNDMKKISIYKAQFKELREYEAITSMDEDERSALHLWVEKGNSVHANPYGAVYEGGIPMDFLDAYRDVEEQEREFREMSSEEQARFVRKYRGEETVEDLKKEIDELEFKLMIYTHVLEKYDLMDYAKAEMQNAKQRSMEFIYVIYILRITYVM